VAATRLAPMTTPPASRTRTRARRMATPVAGLLALGAVTALAEPPPAGNLVANPSFERDPSADWSGFRSTFSQLPLAPGEAPDGSSAVQVVAGPTADGLEGYSIDDAVSSGGTSVPAGTQFVASAWIRAQSPQSIGKLGKVWVRERNADGDLIARLEGEVVLTGAFQRVTTPVFTSQRAGSQVDVYVSQIPALPGDAFAADLVTLSRNAPPAGIISASDTSPKVGATVTFGAGQIVDPEGGAVVSRAWDTAGTGAFADGTGETVTRRFDRVGTYVIRVRSSDAAGATSVLSRTIIVSTDGLTESPPPNAGPGARPSLSRWRVTTTRARVTQARFRLNTAVRLSTVLERKRVGRAGYQRLRATKVKRVAAGNRSLVLGRKMAAGRYRVRLVLRPASGTPRTIVKGFVIRAR
jgi:hypothetical protein